MENNEFKKACEKVILSRRQKSEILKRAEEKASDRNSEKMIRRGLKGSYVFSLAAVIVLICVVTVSTLWRGGESVLQENVTEAVSLEAQNEEPTLSEEEKQYCEEVGIVEIVSPSEDVHEIMLYITKTFGDSHLCLDELEIMMLISIDKMSKEVRIQPVDKESYMHDLNRTGVISRYDMMYVRYGAKDATPLIAADLGVAANDYVVTDVRTLAGVIDYFGGMEVYVSPEDIMEKDRDMEMSARSIYARNSTFSKTSSWKQVGTKTLAGDLAVGWTLCPENSGEWILRWAREEELIRRVLETYRTEYRGEGMDALIEEIDGYIEYGLNDAEFVRAAILEDGEYQISEEARLAQYNFRYSLKKKLELEGYTVE